MRFGMWSVMILYRCSSLTIVARELVRYKLDLVAVQEVFVGQMGHRQSRGLYFFCLGKGKKLSIGTIIFGTPQNSISV